MIATNMDTLQLKPHEKTLDHKMELARSLSNKAILEGTLSSSYVGTVDGETVVCALVDYGGISVVIPASRLTDKMTDQTTEYETTVVKSRLGSRVHFVCTSYDEKSNQATGDSIEANRIRRKRWFRKKDSGEYVIDEGSTVTGDILVTEGLRNGTGQQRQQLIVNVHGAETFIPVKDVTYDRVVDLREIFPPKSAIKLRIVKINKRDEETGEVEFVANHKVFEQDPNVQYFDKFVEGMIGIGRVTSMGRIETKNKNEQKLVIWVRTPEKVSVRCWPSYGAMPRVGDYVNYRVTRKYQFEKKDEHGVGVTVAHINGQCLRAG